MMPYKLLLQMIKWPEVLYLACIVVPPPLRTVQRKHPVYMINEVPL
jgi:hypothetical protein